MKMTNDHTAETQYYPSRNAIDDFISWLKFVLKDKDGNIEAWANHLIMNHDWAASRRIEVSGRQTLSGHPEFYTF